MTGCIEQAMESNDEINMAASKRLVLETFLSKCGTEWVVTFMPSLSELSCQLKASIPFHVR